MIVEALEEQGLEDRVYSALEDCIFESVPETEEYVSAENWHVIERTRRAALVDLRNQGVR